MEETPGDSHGTWAPTAPPVRTHDNHVITHGPQKQYDTGERNGRYCQQICACLQSGTCQGFSCRMWLIAKRYMRMFAFVSGYRYLENRYAVQRTLDF